MTINYMSGQMNNMFMERYGFSSSTVLLFSIHFRLLSDHICVFKEYSSCTSSVWMVIVVFQLT